MKQEICERKASGSARECVPHWLRILLWALLLLNMAVIFTMSSKTAEQSTVTSDAVLAKPLEVYEDHHPESAGDQRVYLRFQFVVRKSAHVLEFASLCLWATGLLLAYRVRFPYLLGGCFTALYAASDELHQLLVPGREGKVTDWLFDCLGALVGVLIVYLIFRIIRKRYEGN